MNKKMILGLLGLAFLAGLSVADDLVPVAVSPGLPDRTAVVRESCPTFSWTSVSWALTYKVVVFQAGSETVPPYESMAAAASPILVKEIPGRALSWTPSAEERLSSGATYVWYVGAMYNVAQGSWSEGRSFLVFEDPIRDIDTRKRIMQTVRENEADEDVAGKILQNKDLGLTEKAISDFDLASGSRSEVEGSEGASNTFYGLSAGAATTTGIYNSFFGRYAGSSNISGKNNTFMGSQAGRYNTASENTFVGYMAGNKNTTGYWNVFLGNTAGYVNTTGYQNTFLGSLAGKANTTGYSNAFLGRCSGMSNTTGFENTFAGIAAGQNNTTGKRNTFIGGFTGYKNTSGYQNTFLGNTAGYFNTTGYLNTFLGDMTGYFNTEGYQNTFIGDRAGYNNTTGFNNTFIGKNAGLITTIGHDNAFFGALAGDSNTEGIQNTFVGSEAGQKNSTGLYNTFIGSCAGYVSQTGGGNTYLGDYAGFYNEFGELNIFIGNEAGSNEMGSSKLYIDVSNTAAPLIYGEFDNDILQFNGKVGIQTTAAPAHLLDVGTGGAYCDGTTWHDGSSREYKENIVELTSAEAMEAFEKLEPVKFNYKANKDEMCLGFIAEDVPDLVAVNDRKSLNPMDMVAMLIKVVQAQHKTLSSQENAISELKEKIAKLEIRSRKEK
jgi:hypothetical protein